MHRQRLRTLHLFAGGGGGLLADLLLGHRTVCAVEIDPYCQSILLARQHDGSLPWFPIFGDVAEFDGAPWRGRVDVIAGGPPCQPWSVAGQQRGADDERNLWPDMLRIVCDVGPRYVFMENVTALLTHEYCGTILGNLAEAGYDAVWCVLGADDVGAPHRRKRLWLLAYANGTRCVQQVDAICARGDSALSGSADVPHANGFYGMVGRSCHDTLQLSRPEPPDVSGGEPGGRTIEPGLGRSPHGLATWVDRMHAGSVWGEDWENCIPRTTATEPNIKDRIKALGNGQVPLCAATAWKYLHSLLPTQEVLEDIHYVAYE